MKSMIKELLHGNIIPQEDSRSNSKEKMKELLSCMARHHENLAKTLTDEHKRSSKSSAIAGIST